MTLLKMATQAISKFWINMLLILVEICEGIRMMNAFWLGNDRSVKGSRGCHERGCVM